MSNGTAQFLWLGVCLTAAYAVLLLTSTAAFGLSIAPLPTPSDMESPELRRFVEIRDTAEKRRYAIEVLSREATRLRRVDIHDAHRARSQAVAFAQVRILTPADEALILRVLDRELSANPPDWERIEWALMAARYGTVQDERFVHHVRAILRYPRGARIVDSHDASLREGAGLLWQMATPAASSLLDEAHAQGYGREHDRNRPSYHLAGSSGAHLLSSVPVLVAPSARSNGQGEEWARLTAYREACEEGVDAAVASLFGRFMNDEPVPNVHFVVERELETARIHAADEEALAFAYSILARESAAGAPDWALVDEALRICFHSDDAPSHLLSAVTAVLEHPRHDSVPDDHLEALSVALAVAGRIGTPEAISLLIQATTAEFWGHTGPVFFPERRRMPAGYEAVEWIRTDALHSIGFAPSEYAAPVLSVVIKHHRPPGMSAGRPPSYQYRAVQTAYSARRLASSREGIQREDRWSVLYR